MIDLEPTPEEVEAHAKNCNPWLFDVRDGIGLDLSGRGHMLAVMQEAEDKLRVARGLKPKFGED